MTIKIWAISFLANLVFVSAPAVAQQTVRSAIQELITATNADVGVAVCFNGNATDTLSINGNRHYPMQSVFKFHIALAVLAKVDEGKWSLDQPVPIRKSELMLNTWSPIQKKYPEGNVSLTLREILTYTVSQSDNNGCDILLRSLGGPANVEDFIHRLGISDVEIRYNEAEMHGAWEVQFGNWTTPRAMTVLLNKFYQGKILSESSTRFLWNIMVDSPTGLKRLKGDLPAGAVVAHKTGTSGVNEAKVMAAVNDSGIVLLPDGRYILISVFVSDTTAPMQQSEKLIAGISRIAWDYSDKR